MPQALGSDSAAPGPVPLGHEIDQGRGDHGAGGPGRIAPAPAPGFRKPTRPGPPRVSASHYGSICGRRDLPRRDERKRKEAERVATTAWSSAPLLEEVHLEPHSQIRYRLRRELPRRDASN